MDEYYDYDCFKKQIDTCDINAKTQSALNECALDLVNVFDLNGDTHFLVRKEEKSRTNTSIVKLSEKESIEEIARLLSGESITKSSLENASNLKQKALTTQI